ncbi:Holliday junction branch migration protein RuvA [Candidatus Kaiserbacteria bacterium]|nr:Holliday junction branch migration protein RuvA [Candidatus Kaiserbacteria bacterium]
MIARLRGTIASIHDHHLVIDVGGVGYKVFAMPATLATLRPDAPATLVIYTAVREDALDLYGFLHDQERLMFELLLTVSGIGPKSALTIISLAGIETLVSAITAGKASYLTNVSGIGKKTAEKVVLELKDKIDSLGIASAIADGDEGAIEALRVMGYSIKEAREALQSVPDTVEGEGARLREALRALGK